MKRFILKLAVFLGPVAVYLVLTTGSLLYAGEFAPLREVALRQAGPEPTLYGRSYRDNFFAYKLIATQVRQPRIVVVGSSRSMQFRSMFFNKQAAAFYNAGGAVQNIYELHEFLRQLPADSPPETLLVVLDQPWFHVDSGTRLMLQRVQEQIDDENVIAPFRALTTSSLFLNDLLSGRVDLARLIQRQDGLYGVPALGLNAVLRGSGFRNDGSYQYGFYIPQPPSTAQRMAESYERIRANISHFIKGSQLSESSLQELSNFLEDCRKRGITVIGLSPPYAPGVVQTMLADQEHEYLRKQQPVLRDTFARFGFAYFDFTDPAPLGITDDDMLDGFHGSEWAMLKIYLVMLDARPDLLERYSDAAYLQAVLQRAPANRYVLFAHQIR